MPRGFTYPFGTDAWSALLPALAGIGQPELPNFLATREAAVLHVVGPPQTGRQRGRGARRSRSGQIREVSLEDHIADMSLLPHQAARRRVARQTRTALCALIAAVALLLLVAATNVAGLMIVQTTRPRRQFAVRMALAHPGRRSPGSCCASSAILVGRGVCSCPAACEAGLPIVVALVPQACPWLDEAEVNLRVAAFTALVGMTMAVLCWIAPALSLESVEARCRAAERRTDVRLRRIQPSGTAAARRRGNCGRRRRPGSPPACSLRSVSRLGQNSTWASVPVSARRRPGSRPPQFVARAQPAVDRFYDSTLSPPSQARLLGVRIGRCLVPGRPLKGPIRVLPRFVVASLTVSWRTRPGAIHGQSLRRSRRGSSGRWRTFRCGRGVSSTIAIAT